MNSKMKSKEIITKILESADIKINGDRSWDIKVLDERVYDRVLSQGTLGLGESYMDNWWECEELDEGVNKLFRFGNPAIIDKNLSTLFHVLKSKTLNLQTKSRAKQVAENHYDLGNDLYTSFLDPYMQYSCGYFKNTEDLEIAQKQKMDLICKKLDIRAGEKVLDIGCGWGGLARYMSENYGANITGITISKEQAEYAKKFTEDFSVNIELMDYRNLSGKFDKVVSVGMLEHVGYKNYRQIFEIVKEHIKDDGLFLLHTIGNNESATMSGTWIEKYIFPNSMLPSQKQLTSSWEGLFVMEDWHNFGQYYDFTLMAWYKNFVKAWPNLKEKYGERFYRMFRFYLLSSAGLFRARNIHLWQIVLSPKGVLGGYESVR